MSAPQRLVVSFNGRHVAVECGTEWLAVEVRRRLMHLVAAPDVAASWILRVFLDELEASWIEVRDSTGRCERGSFDYVVYHARKWMTTAFVGATPDLIWLHASAASVDGAAILLAGPAGSGKSSLLLQLIDCGWHLLADDAVALRRDRGDALPLPFSPEVRAASCEFEQDEPGFLAQPKTLVTIAPNRVASKPAAVSAIVFPEYARHASRAVMTPLTVVSAAQALATQVLGDHEGGRNIAELFHLAGEVPAYRLHYGDSSAAGRELARLGRLHGHSRSTDALRHRRAVSSSVPDARSPALRNVNPRRRASPES